MEDSVNLVKGYGKINPTDEEKTNAVTFTSHSPSRSRRITATVILTLSVFAIITAVITATTIIHRHRHHKPPEPNLPNQSPSVNLSESIKTVCHVTQHPATCFTDISSINSGNAVDPVTIFNLTVQLTLTELTNVSSLPKTLISESNDLRTGSALRDCASLFDDAVSRLGDSVEAMNSGELTEAKVADMMTWISAAMTDQQTCVDGLEEVGSTAVDEVKMKVQRSSEWMSNTLAILNNMESILTKFGLHLH